MGELEHEVRDLAEDAAADVAAPVAAVTAEHVAAEAARDAVEPVVEQVADLVERAEEAIETSEENQLWERLNTTLLESERRIMTGVQTAMGELRASLSSQSIPPTPVTDPEAMETLEQAAEELADAAGDAQPEQVAEFDPLAVESAPEQEASGRRRPRGLGRRR